MHKNPLENVAIIKEPTDIIARSYETSQRNLTTTWKADGERQQGQVGFYFLLLEPLDAHSRSGILVIYFGFIVVRHPDCALHIDTLTSAIDFLYPGNPKKTDYSW